MTDPLPILAVPGLMCSARLYADQIPALWPFGPITIADHCRDETMDATARRILGTAPPRFALIGLSMGVPERTEARRTLIVMAEQGHFGDVVDLHFPQFVHKNRRDDAGLKRWCN